MSRLPLPPRRTRASGPGVAVSLFLTDAQYARLKACADESGDDVAAVVVDAIELHLDERGELIDAGVLIDLHEGDAAAQLALALGVPS